MKKLLNIFKWTFIISIAIGIVVAIVNPKSEPTKEEKETEQKKDKQKIIDEALHDVRYNKSNEIKTQIQKSLNDEDSYETIEEKTYLLNDSTIVYYLQYSAKNGFNATIKKEITETFNFKAE